MRVIQGDWNMKEEDRAFLWKQLLLITEAECALDQLLKMTYEDHHYGRGFGSLYPSKALDNIKTMRMHIEMECKNEG